MTPLEIMFLLEVSTYISTVLCQINGTAVLALVVARLCVRLSERELERSAQAWLRSPCRMLETYERVTHSVMLC